jgi:hypothetical protein
MKHVENGASNLATMVLSKLYSTIVMEASNNLQEQQQARRPLKNLPANRSCIWGKTRTRSCVEITLRSLRRPTSTRVTRGPRWKVDGQISK